MLSNNPNYSAEALADSDSEDEVIIDEEEIEEDDDEESSNSEGEAQQQDADSEAPITDDRRFDAQPLPPSVILNSSKLSHEASLDRTRPAVDEESTVIVSENRYCTVCNIDQPIRAKH
jgi:hypothetical protein